MLLRTLLVTCLFACTSLFAGFKYELGLCAIFKDDVKYLPEWIEFHEKQGVQHFWLYNNGLGGKSDYIDYLEPYITSGLVEVIEWPFEFKEYWQWGEIQKHCYMYCFKKIRDICKWCAVLDTDEFLFSPSGKPLPMVLNEYDAFGAVGVNWVLYGTSNIRHIPEGKKMTNHLLYRSDIDFGGNKSTKCIVKPNLVTVVLNPHEFSLVAPSEKVDEHKQVFVGHSTDRVSVDILRINHYWSRDLDFFHNVKLPSVARRYGDVEAQIEKERDHLNQVYDPIITNFN